MSQVNIPQKLNNWDDADAVLRAIGELEFKKEALEAEATRKVQALKEEYTPQAEEIQDQLKKLEKRLRSFVKKKKQDIAEGASGRTKVLLFGKVGVRSGTRIVIPDEEVTITALKSLRLYDAIITKESPSREALEKYDETTLTAVFARREETDKTWYEVDREKFKGIAKG